MKISSFNINSIKARIENLKFYLENEDIDIICLQETKTTNETFPFNELDYLGYNIEINGQKSYNGVAILSKPILEDVIYELPLIDDSMVDDQARYLEGTFFLDKKTPIRLVNIYAPHGNPIGSDKFEFKLAWMERLYERAKLLLSEYENILIIGDFNIIPDVIDAKNPDQFVDNSLFVKPSLKSLYSLFHLGFQDSFRICHKDLVEYSYWDYQAGAFQRNNGIRIDLALSSPSLSTKLQDVGMHKYMRKKDKPSDHVPIWIEI